MHSLRAALIIGTTIATALVLSAAGILLYVLARASLIEQMDRALLDKARLVATGVETNNGKIQVDFTPFHVSGNEPLEPRDYLQLWQDRDKVLFRSETLDKIGLDRFGDSGESAEYRWLSLPDGRNGRAVGITFGPRAEDVEEEDGKIAQNRKRTKSVPKLTLVLARDIGPMNSTLAGLRVLLGLVGCAAIAISTGVLLVIIRRSLRPLDRLAAEIGRIGEQDLSTRIDVPGTPRELEPVTARLNDLLERLEAAFQRERGFSADVAHELRTPLAGLRSTIDVTLGRIRQTADYVEALEDCRQITSLMQAMVENLTSLARLEAGQVAFQPESVSLDKLVRDYWKPLENLAKSRQLRVEWMPNEECSVDTDAAHFGLVVRNILENAVSHADTGGLVQISFGAADHQAVFSVVNSGSNISQDQVKNIFKRFWRGDAARSDTGTHCGLGLALTKKIVSVLGGTVCVKSSPGGNFEITVAIPNNSGAQ